MDTRTREIATSWTAFILSSIALTLFAILAINKTKLTFLSTHIIETALFSVLFYVLFSLTIISFSALIKGGFSKLKDYKKGGLLGFLIAGLKIGLILAFVVGFAGMTATLVLESFAWSIGIYAGTSIGLISGLLGGILFGLADEFDIPLARSDFPIQK